MKSFFSFFVRPFSLMLLCLASWITTAAWAGPAPSSSLAPMLEKIMPSIVNIRAEVKITDLATLNRIQKNQQAQNNFGPLPDKVLSVGSGVIVNASKGYILTNAHVVENAESVMVTLSDGHHYTAKVIGLDRPSDIALLQIRAKNLSAITIGNSSDLKVGDPVIAIGNPYGLNQSVTSGIISALGRNTLGIEAFENFIQIDAPINPGNSGGALVNSSGALIGINTAILSPGRGNTGIGFAIPSNLATSVMRQLIEYGDVKRGILGVGVQDLSPDLGAAFNMNNAKGAVVTLVMPNTPAQTAGLQVGDVITAVNNTPISVANDVVNAIGFLRVNSKANLTVLRKGKKINLSAVLNDPKQREQQGQEADPFFHGVALKHFTLLSPVQGNINGILVVSVQEDTNAWRSDLRAGDVITMANQQTVTSIEQLKKIAASTKEKLLLNVLRGNGALFLVISKDE